MIVDLPDTTTSKVSKEVQSMREQGGVVALGRVLTLIVLTEEGQEEAAIDAANLASREHPCRIIVLVEGDTSAETQLNAQIRVGGDAGASEVIVLHAQGSLCAQGDSLVAALLLPDAPIVAWWPDRMPETAAQTDIGKIAHRRITDSANETAPARALKTLSENYHEGDTDLAWTRLTGWRVQLASALDQLDDLAEDPVRSVLVEGAADSPSTLLLAAWLQKSLQVPATVAEGAAGTGLHRVVLDRAAGPLEIHRPENDGNATITQPGQPEQRISLPRRSLQDCLSEELRRLDPDEVFGETIVNELPELKHSSRSAEGGRG
ncbi:glucose-6-phosphate dehydrogenase assembly protein OpcA [Acaricomes phytoseiuli]|uniref:glucose-6-phosphate dehydrogenase assembly protein OpcA n=1 Tax=Acaricomes phytoseiuli TaxID=291968 RepID=UPI002222CDCB|nr:glucose-6-phosphate dehydrogenase assembly protein OpcA [Acaricomes phytoseiuli]MCW1250308.1 glucose-6-phosphate dehydrogenase assembly protein OpcA [Acaricomes phytoseiuli]